MWKKKHKRAGPANVIRDSVDWTFLGTHEIEITSVSLGADLENLRQVPSKSRWWLLIRIKSHIVEHNLVVGERINDPLGLVVYGANSVMRGQKMRVAEGEFTVRVDFPRDLGAEFHPPVPRDDDVIV